MDGAGQQSTQNGESSQGETQGAGGDEVASGKDRETGSRIGWFTTSWPKSEGTKVRCIR